MTASSFACRRATVRRTPPHCCHPRLPSTTRVTRQLGSTALFAARFRENAARALLLPRRRPGIRTALWQQRKRSADLLNVASRYPSFAILLETYRECIRDIFDLPALAGILGRIESGADSGHHGGLGAALAICRHRCCSATSPTTFTTAMRRWPSAARRRCRSISRNSRTCWAMPIIANFSMVRVLRELKKQLQWLGAA